jgi:hypothetical protein
VVIDGTAAPDKIFAQVWARGPPHAGEAALMAPRTPAVQEIEALPEADRLDDLPHPRATRALYGHEAVETGMAQAFAGGRMHHAWLLAGREGIGKATLAYRLARHVLARPEERDRLGQSLEVAADSTAARQVGAAHRAVGAAPPLRHARQAFRNRHSDR